MTGSIIWRVFVLSLMLAESCFASENVVTQRKLLGGLDMRTITEQQIKNLTEKQFLPNLSANKPELLQDFNEVKVLIVDAARPTARSIYEGGRRTIEINTGLTFLVMLYNEYSLLRNYYPNKINSKCNQYIKYLGERFKGMISAEKFDYHDESITAGHFCDAENLRTQEYAGNYIKLLEMDRSLSAVLGFVLGHEYGHHLLGHLPLKQMEPVEYRKIEKDADNFGSNLLGNYASRTGSTLIFDLLEKQRRSDPFSSERRYPAEECRFLYLMREDARFWGGHQGYELLQYLNEHVELKERFPRALEFVDARKSGKSIVTRCDDETRGKNKEEIGSVSAKVRISECFERNSKLERVYTETYYSINKLNDLIPNKERRKTAACPKFKKLVVTLKDMIALKKRCTVPTALEADNVVKMNDSPNIELLSIFEKIVAECRSLERSTLTP